MQWKEKKRVVFDREQKKDDDRTSNSGRHQMHDASFAATLSRALGLERSKSYTAKRTVLHMRMELHLFLTSFFLIPLLKNETVYIMLVICIHLGSAESRLGRSPVLVEVG